jgi:hypothetical protein
MNYFWFLNKLCFEKYFKSVYTSFKSKIIKTLDSLGIHFNLRMNKQKNGSTHVYATILLNGERIEMFLRKLVKVKDWNTAKGLSKPKIVDLKTLNNCLEQTR